MRRTGVRTTPVGWAAIAALGLAASAPPDASAQAVCSAPHSSPTLAQSGSIRTLYRGAGWIQLSLYGQRSTAFFNHLGDRQDFLADARFDTRSVFLTGAYGVRDGLELWAQVPTHRLAVDASGRGTRSTGLGDVRLAVRVGPELFGSEAPVAVRVGAKLPGSDFPVDATVLPLTEGQTDFEISVEAGAGLGDLPVYLMGWAGYRWRSENQEAARKPGSERYAHAAVGGMLGSWSWELAGDALWGAAPEASGIRVDSERRRLIQLLPTVGYPLGPGRLEATGQLPLSGRSLPVGYGLSLGYRATWGL